LDAMHDDQRPWLSVEVIPQRSVYLASNARFYIRVKFVLKNSGRLPALSASVHPNGTIGEAALGDGCNNDNPAKDFSHFRDQVGISVLPNQERTNTDDVRLGPNLAENADRHFFISGCVAYKLPAQFDQDWHRTNFVYYLTQHNQFPNTDIIQFITPKNYKNPEVPPDQIDLIPYAKDGIAFLAN
jgi:hypothetical protein